MCVRFSRFFGICAALVITFALCLGGIEASASSTITKMSIADTRSFFGDSISANVRVSGASAWQTTIFYFDSSYTSFSPSGMNLASNFFADSYAEFEDYDILIYTATVPTLEYIDLQIDLPIYFPDYAIGAFAVFNRPDSWSMSGITQSGNMISNSPDNYYSDFDAIIAREPSTAWGLFSSSLSNGNGYWRLYPYVTDSDGTFFNTLSVQSVRCCSSGSSYISSLMIFCPHVGSEPSHSEPVVTTTTDSSSSGGSTIINNNVDMSQTNGLLSNIISGLQSLGQSILSGIEHIFVPEQGYFDNKIAQVKAKFAWYEDIVDAWTEFKTALNNISADSPPSITLSLDNRTFFGQPIGSGSGTALVLDWMITYRNVIRNLLTAFMWIFFLWRLYCHIPNIISGSGMEVQKTDEGAAWTIHGKKL